MVVDLGPNGRGPWSQAKTALDQSRCVAAPTCDSPILCLISSDTRIKALREKADGRRVFSTEFERTAVQRILSGEKTLAELSRELDISPGVIRNWKRFAEAGATTSVHASEDVVPASHLRDAYAKIRELERALGWKTMEVEILRAAHCAEVILRSMKFRIPSEE